jgi:hypothetical protein
MAQVNGDNTQHCSLCSLWAKGSEGESGRSMKDLVVKVVELEARLVSQQAEMDTKNKRIQSLEEQIATQDLQATVAATQSPLPDNEPLSEAGVATNDISIVDKVQKWLFLEGGDLRDVPSLLSEYCNLLRNEMGLPLDRFYVAGMMLPPEVSAHVWKWESDKPQVVEQHEVPHEVVTSNPDEPFGILMEGRAMEYRMNAAEKCECGRLDNVFVNPAAQKIARGKECYRCSWFDKGNYQDYLALPMYHQGEFKGAMAWSSKAKGGFTAGHIESFSKSLAALSTVLRCHTNEIVMSTLMGRLQDQVDKRTLELATANEQIRKHSQTQLRHFAMMR